MKSVRLKRSSVASKKPTTTGGTPDLDYGDLALNFNSGSPTLFSRGHDDTLLEWHAGRELPAVTRAGDVLTLESAGAAAMQALVMAPYTALPTYDPRMQPVLASSALPDPNDPGRPYGGAGNTQSSKDFSFIYNGKIYTLTGVADNGANYVGTPDRWLTTGRNASVRAVTPVPQVVPTPAWKTPASAASAGTNAPVMDGTASAGSATAYAREDHVHPTDTSRAPLASPTFTGVPAGPTAVAGTNTTQLATTAFVKAATPDATEAIKGLVELATAAETTTGTDSTRAVHPAGLKVELDKKANLASPALTGTPTAPTAAAGTSTTQLATTAFVQAANLLSRTGTTLSAKTPGDLLAPALMPAATATAQGAVQLADAAAITAGTAGRVVDAAQLKANVPVLADATTTVKGVVQLATSAEAAAGTDAAKAVTAKALHDGYLAKNIALLPALP